MRAPHSIAAMEHETGLTRDVVRKWESRYGFPRPDRDANGTRVYPAEQVDSLCLIRQLLCAGLRPGKVVGLDRSTLGRMVERLGPPEAQVVQDEFIQDVIAALQRHDLAHVSKQLKRALLQQGVSPFLRQSLHPLIATVGEMWKRGEIRLFEEHLFTQVTSNLLHEALSAVATPSGRPRFLLSTPPKELHTLGLLMVEIALSLKGAACIGLGAQTPGVEIAEAADGCRIDIVGLAFSAAFPKRGSTRMVCELRQILPPATELWVGGQGAGHLAQIAGVRCIRDLDALETALLAWRERHR